VRVRLPGGVALRGYVVFGAVAIAAGLLIYTQLMIAQVRDTTSEMARMYARIHQYAASGAGSGAETSFLFEEVIKKSRLPIIVTDIRGKAVAWERVGVDPRDTTTTAQMKVQRILAHMAESHEPVPLTVGRSGAVVSYLYYGDPPIVARLRWMPVIAVGVIGLFGLVAFMGYIAVRREQERFIWVGMAKETAHQLGTPLSALMGWLELLRMRESGEAATDDMSEHSILEQMEGDVDRLQRIATRFGQIGSLPELVPTDLSAVMHKTVGYFRRRLPSVGSGLTLAEDLGETPTVMANAELLSWAFENMLKNASEAVDSMTGRIAVTTCTEGKNRACIRIADNGRGIHPRDHRRIFDPGRTNKKRGWGLGLSLAKRIVEDYHGGRITLEHSLPEKGSIFLITLPAALETTDNG
jgi:hypothetical protein